MAAVMDYHKFSSLKQHTCIISQFSRSKVVTGLAGFSALGLTHLKSHWGTLARIILQRYLGFWWKPVPCIVGLKSAYLLAVSWRLPSALRNLSLVLALGLYISEPAIAQQVLLLPGISLRAHSASFLCL